MNFATIFSVILGLFTACNQSTKLPDTPVQVAYIDFENNDELNNWNLSSQYGHTEMDQNIKYAGSQSIHFSPDTGCYIVDRKTGIDVQAGKKYSITFNVIVSTTQIGKQSYCAGDFILTVRQGSQEILYQSVFDAPSWEQKTYYFIAVNDLPVNLDLIIGNDVWIDNISMVREIE